MGEWALGAGKNVRTGINKNKKENSGPLVPSSCACVAALSSSLYPASVDSLNAEALLYVNLGLSLPGGSTWRSISRTLGDQSRRPT